MSELARLDDAALHHRDETRAIFEYRNIRQHITIDHQHIGEFAGGQRSQFVFAAQNLCAGFRGTFDRIQRAEADVLDEEGQLAR